MKKKVIGWGIWQSLVFYDQNMYQQIEKKKTRLILKCLQKGFSYILYSCCIMSRDGRDRYCLICCPSVARCQTMCPESEIAERLETQDVHCFEKNEQNFTGVHHVAVTWNEIPPFVVISLLASTVFVFIKLLIVISYQTMLASWWLDGWKRVEERERSKSEEMNRVPFNQISQSSIHMMMSDDMVYICSYIYSSQNLIKSYYFSVMLFLFIKNNIKSRIKFCLFVMLYTFYDSTNILLSWQAHSISMMMSFFVFCFLWCLDFLLCCQFFYRADPIC